MSNKNLCVIGLGYVGSITAYNFAATGQNVVGVEIDRKKVDLLQRGLPHFYEPGFSELVKKNKDRILITSNLSDLDFSIVDFVFICLPTPIGPNGRLNLSLVFKLLEDLILNESFTLNKKCSIVIRSTIETNTISFFRRRLKEAELENDVLFHPEFLREGSAIADFLNPPFILCSNPRNVETRRNFEKLYEDIGKVQFTNTENLELLKVSCNTWHALKVAFANEIDAIAREIGANGVEVMKLFVSDKLLNISEAYLKPGFAFGGSCLPKDTSSLSNIAAKLGCKLIPAINPSNEFVIDSWVSRFLAYEYDVVNWVGITFKEHTDDVRDSPYLIALDRILTLSKVRVNFFDPHFTSKAFGRNKEIYWDLKLRSNITIVDSLDLLDSNILTFVAHDYKSLGISDRFSHFLKIV